MREFHGLDLEDLLTTETAAIVIGQRYLDERYQDSTLPLGVRYLDVAGERQVIEVVRASA